MNPWNIQSLERCFIQPDEDVFGEAKQRKLSAWKEKWDKIENEKRCSKDFQKSSNGSACWDAYARETAHHAGTGMLQSCPHVPVEYNLKSVFHLEISQIEEIL